MLSTFSRPAPSARKERSAARVLLLLSRRFVFCVSLSAASRSGARGVRLGSPAQDGLARGGGLVESAGARRVRRVKNRVRVFDGLARNLLHGVYELLKLRAADRLGGLNQHRTLYDEREVDRHRVEAVINQTLRDVERVDALARLPLVCEENF